MRSFFLVGLCFSLGILSRPSSAMQVGGQGKALSWQSVDEKVVSQLVPGDLFGNSVASAGDLNGDGTPDLVVGAPEHDTGSPASTGPGAVFVLFLRSDGSVDSFEVIETMGVPPGTGIPGASDGFGHSVATLGDLDGDGVCDLAVGAPGDAEAGAGGNGVGGAAGAVWIVFLDRDGGVKSRRKITTGQSGFPATLAFNTSFGTGVAGLGDLDADGVPDMVVGMSESVAYGGGFHQMFVVLLNADGTVKDLKGLSGPPTATRFGDQVACLGDVDGDGNPELVTEASGNAIVLFLDASGTIKRRQTVGPPPDGSPPLAQRFGRLDDMDQDGVPELLLGAPTDDGQRGAAWVVFLNRQAQPKRWQKLSSTEGNVGELPDDGSFGSVAGSPDINGDGIPDLFVGAPSARRLQPGSVHTLFLDDGQLAATFSIGCNVNPQGSLSVVDGRPSIGTLLALGVDDPTGSFALGATPVLGLSPNPNAAYPCGTIIPAWGMRGDGEFLLGRAYGGFLTGLPWQGPGNPAHIDVHIPLDSQLVGLLFYVQGALVDVSDEGLRVGLTTGFELRIGL